MLTGALIFCYVGTETATGGWLASYAQRLDSHVETFTIRAEPTAAGPSLVLEWERTRVVIPVRPAS